MDATGRSVFGWVPDGATGGRQASSGLAPMLDLDLQLVFVFLHTRPEVVQKGWCGPQLTGHSNDDLTWFGHRSSDDAKGAARISFGVDEYKPGKAPTKVPYFLSILDAKTKPRLVLTADADKATNWSLAVEKTWSHSEGRPDAESRVEATTGFIQATGIPGVQLWLAISPEPILQTRRESDGRGGEKKETMEYRLLTVSPKKDCRVQYERVWSPSGK